MSGIVDCALLMLPAHAAWGRRWIERHGDRLGRVRLHAMWLADPQAAADAQVPVQALHEAQLALRRYDAGLLLVNYRTLGWTRTALAGVPAAERAPMLALVDDLQAPAVQDLLHLGLEDFLRDPCALDDVRARIERQAARARCLPVVPGTGRAGRPGPGATGFPPAGTMAGLQAPLPGPGALRAASGSGQPRAPCLGEPLPAAVPPAAVFRPDEPFRQAKSRIVATFERDYISRALARHAGNIAMAARATRKHRRAFWALMRKHGIEAGPYREAARAGFALPDGACRPGR